MPEQLLGAATLIFVSLFVLAAAVEAVLELFRGLLGQVGITWVKGATSLDQALELAKQVTPKDDDLGAKLAALKTTVGKVTRFTGSAKQAVDKRIADADSLIASINSAGAVPSGSQLMTLSADLNKAADLISEHISNHERTRILVLRSLAVLIGVAIAGNIGFDVLEIAKSYLPQIKAPTGEVLGLTAGEAVAGVAASSGSSYWHDKIDKVRSLKNAYQQATSLIR